MKKIISMLAVCLLVVTAMAQNEKYVNAMQANLTKFDTVKTTAGFIDLSNAFARIGDAEKNQWLPYYYAALSLSTAGWMDQSLDKDANAEKIKAFCTKAEAINDNAEICAVRNMAATQQMLVDPQTRWQTYGPEASSALEKGLKLEPNNPRLHFLQASSVYNTPEQFGGGKDKAKPMLEKTLELFNAENPKPLYPHWGKNRVEEMLASYK
ncbi:MAG: hypothetical protein IT249_02045 [Chitinophagaceae bacterium]|nr:hypothetical protein [Chitinophagaceae bacterium]